MRKPHAKKAAKCGLACWG